MQRTPRMSKMNELVSCNQDFVSVESKDDDLQVYPPQIHRKMNLKETQAAILLGASQPQEHESTQQQHRTTTGSREVSESDTETECQLVAEPKSTFLQPHEHIVVRDRNRELPGQAQKQNQSQVISLKAALQSTSAILNQQSKRPYCENRRRRRMKRKDWSEDEHVREVDSELTSQRPRAFIVVTKRSKYIQKADPPLPLKRPNAKVQEVAEASIQQRAEHQNESKPIPWSQWTEKALSGAKQLVRTASKEKSEHIDSTLKPLSSLFSSIVKRPECVNHLLTNRDTFCVV